MDEIQGVGNKSAQTKGDEVGFAHVFAAVHDLNRGDFESFGEVEGGDGTAGFVVDVKNVESCEFGVVFEEPAFDDLRTARNRGETAKKEFATGDEEDVLLGEFSEFGFRTGEAGAENVNGVAESLEGGFLGVHGTHNSAGEVEVTIRKESDFHTFIIT